MHTITATKNQIQVIFDKQLHGWSWDKTDIRYAVSHDYKEKSPTITTIPATAKSYTALMNRYKDDDKYIFTEEFINEYILERKSNTDLAVKRKLLKEKLTLDNIRERPYLLDYSQESLPNCPPNELLPFKHQQLELEYQVRFPGFYSLDEMGLGKTRTAIERYLFLKKRGVVNKTLVVCPNSLLYNWQNEIKKWTKNCTTLIVSGSKKSKIDSINMLLGKIDFYIINFEGLHSIKAQLKNLVDSKTNIIIDEFIKIKNHSARRSKDLIEICDSTDYVVGLCGTPVSQGSIDLFSPNLCIDKGKKFGFSYDRFIEKFYWKEGWKLLPKKNATKNMSDKLYLNAIRFTKKQCTDLPEKLYNQIIIDLPSQNQDVYDQMVRFAISELEGKEVTAPIILVQLLRLSQITSGFIKTPENKIQEFKEQPKINALRDIFDSNNGASMIVWSRFTRDIKAIANLCMEKNMSFGCLVGSMNDIYYDRSKTDKNSPLARLIDLIKPIPPINIESIKTAYRNKVKELHPDLIPYPNVGDYSKIEELKTINNLYTTCDKFNNIVLPDMKQADYVIPENLIGKDAFTRQAIVDKFQAGNIQVIIGTAATGGMGINLTAAERVIYYSNDYSLINRLQSEDRAHRTGQKNQVSYYDILAKNTIDISILDVLSGKKSVADVITKDNLQNFTMGK